MERGIYAEIEENKCEGMIRLETLNGKWTANVDKYFASNELGDQIRLGDPIKVVVASVDLEKRQINFTRF
jgi:ribonuclease R